MPAVRHRVYLCPEGDGEPAAMMELPVWWRPAAVFRQHESRVIDVESLSYVDHALLLGVYEALNWDRRFRESFAEDSRSALPAIEEQQLEFEAALLRAKWVIVEAYEWESGLD